jgi:hydroxymethylbilane synthase
MTSEPIPPAHPSHTPPFMLGTRGSPLALAQSNMVAAALRAAHRLPDGSIAITVVQTLGDRVQDRPLADIGGKALWTKELDRALIDGEIDFAVHSMKDVETRLAPGVALAAVLPRADPRDRLIGATSLAEIATGATVGTSSPRRQAQVLHARPDLKVVVLRGNVETRLRHIREGAVAATFLAAAGLDRLGIAAGTTLPLERWLPAASQGVVGITCRADDARTLALLARINHPDTRICLDAERALLDGLGGSCHTAVAAHASLEGGLALRAELFSPDGRDRIAGAQQADGRSPEALGHALADQLMATATAAIRRSLEPVGAA